MTSSKLPWEKANLQQKKNGIFMLIERIKSFIKTLKKAQQIISQYTMECLAFK